MARSSTIISRISNECISRCGFLELFGAIESGVCFRFLNWAPYVCRLQETQLLRWRLGRSHLSKVFLSITTKVCVAAEDAFAILLKKRKKLMLFLCLTDAQLRCRASVADTWLVNPSISSFHWKTIHFQNREVCLSTNRSMPCIKV